MLVSVVRFVALPLRFMIIRLSAGVISSPVNVTNATSEAINGRIQWIKKAACGFRNGERFREAILFQLGDLDMMPKYQISAHSKP